MHILFVILFLISGSINAKNTLDAAGKEQLNQNLELIENINNYSKTISGIDFFTVGADTACQYNTIQSAIDDYFQSPLGNIDIRIATNKTYNENLTIGNANISLSGGYDNCSDADNDLQNNNQALINANNSGTVLTIQGVTTKRVMNFTNLRLINGNNPIGPGGGLLSDTSKVSLLLENVDIRNNNATYGAGIAIIGGDTDLIMRESLIFGNVAKYAGGIYCQGSSSSVNVANHSGIISNFANSPLAVAPNGRGAGAYIEGCYFAIFTGSHTNGSLSGMEVNTSENDGGAIYAENAIIRLHGHQSCGGAGCLGDDTNPVSFRSNQSNFGDGAVLYAVNSDVKINAAWVEGNAGDSIFYLEGSELVLERAQQACWNGAQCNLIEGNSGVILTGFGNGNIEISSVSILDNSTTVFDINSSPLLTNPLFRVESSMINNNGDNNNDYLFNFFGLMNVQFIHNTISDNQVSESIFRTDYNSNITSPITLEIHSSIIDNPFSFVYSFNELGFTTGGGGDAYYS